MNCTIVRTNWTAFLLLGMIFSLLGGVAIFLPRISTVATGLIVGVTLAGGGFAQIIEAFQVKLWCGFVWNLSTGVLATVGGTVIFLTPLTGAVTLTTLIAAAFLVQGCAQIAFAIKIRAQLGWGWLLASGIFALLAAAGLYVHFPFSGIYEPSIVAGIWLLFAGCCYMAFAVAVRWPASVWLYVD